MVCRHFDKVVRELAGVGIVTSIVPIRITKPGKRTNISINSPEQKIYGGEI